MSTRLIFVCHAPTSAVRAAAFPDDEAIDLPVGDFGGEIGPVDRALIGPERRTAETAAALELGVPFVVERELRDCDYGRWVGRRFADVEAEEPEAIAAWTSEPEAAPHGGESIADLYSRVAAWMEAKGREGGRMMAVSHPAVIRAAIIHAMDAPLRSFWRVQVEPLSFTDLRWNKGRWTVRSVAAAGKMVRPDLAAAD